MLITLLAPSKTMEMDAPDWAPECKKPVFEERIESLLKRLRPYDEAAMQTLMKVSPTLAKSTCERFASFDLASKGTPALFAYRGDAYQSLDAASLSPEAVAWVKKRLVILSGLYGALLPEHGVQPYRLEMGLSLPDAGVLSTWWKEEITAYLEELAGNEGILINLASGEYAKAIDKKKFKGRFVEVAFKERQGDKLKSVAIYAKRARGAMARYILENRIDSVDGITGFTEDGYRFDEEGSKSTSILFVRG